MKKMIAVVFTFMMLAVPAFAGQQLDHPSLGGVTPGQLMIPRTMLIYGYDGISTYNVPYVGSDGALLTRDTVNVSRTPVSYFANNVLAGATGVSTAITLIKSTPLVSSASGTSFVITSGKKFRITNISVGTRGNVTGTAQSTIISLMTNTAGIISASTNTLIQMQSATPATSLAWDRVTFPLPDGFEITGDGTLQFGISAVATFVTNTPTISVNIMGYEY
jgi:hypothetical protein